MIGQKTLKAPLEFTGKGLHTGEEVCVRISPLGPDQGIQFCRVDIDPDFKVKATIEHVCSDELRQTMLMVGEAKVRTIEHIMATFHGLGVDNALVSVDGEEIPGMDGSSKAFTESIVRVGLEEQAAPRRPIEIKEPIYIDQGDQSLVMLPSDQFSISYHLSYRHEDLEDQSLTMTILPEIFERELAPARTFCLKQEAEYLLAQGFGKGANVTNTLVFERGQPIDNELRYEDEACRHKIMDLMGDLYLAGAPIKGHVIANRTGHTLNTEFVRKLVMANKEKNPPVPETLNVDEIQKIIPHRYPFLFVDRIEELKPGQRAVGFKQVTMNDYFFQGHFPGHPVMPGVIIIEAMAQVGGVIMLSKPENRNKIAYFMSIDSAKFRQPVVPGDTLKMVVEAKRIRARTGQCEGRAYVGDKLVCEAEVKFAVVDR